MAKKNRATFAKREKERARLSKQAEKRHKRQQTPDPNAPQVPGPMPLMSMFADDENGESGENAPMEGGEATTESIAVDQVTNAPTEP